MNVDMLQSGSNYNVWVRPNGKRYTLTYITQENKQEDYWETVPHKRNEKGEALTYRTIHHILCWNNLIFCNSSNELVFLSDKEILRVEGVLPRV